MCEELARGELEVMERDARCAFFYQDQLSKIAVRAYQRQARDAVNQAVRIFRKLRSYDDATVFKVFRTDLKDEWKKMEEQWHK